MKYYQCFKPLFIVVFMLISIPTFGGVGQINSTFQAINVSSSTHQGNGISYVEAYSTPITIEGAPWLQLRFTNTNLGTGSYIEIISTQDSGMQRLGPNTIHYWHHRSAFFNGEEVTVKLFVAPFDQDIQFTIDSALAGEELDTTASLFCGNNNLTLSNDNRVCRIVEGESGSITAWGTGFLIAGNLVVTAQHVYNAVTDQNDKVCVVEFNVPHSVGNTIRHSSPEDQYVIDRATIKESGSEGMGEDWCVFSTYPNLETGLRAEQTQGEYSVSNVTTPESVKVLGYGSTGPEGSRAYQRYNTGQFVYDVSRMIGTYTWVENGMSGGPVVDLANNSTVIGIVTDKCFGGEGSLANIATSFKNPELWAALGDKYLFVNQVIFDERMTSLLTVFDKQSAGLLWMWDENGSEWDTIRPPKLIEVEPGTIKFFLSETIRVADSIGQSYKFHDWDNTEHQRYNHIEIEQSGSQSYSYLYKTVGSVTVKNGVIGFPYDDGMIEFKDPWLLNTNISNHRNARSHRKEPLFKQRKSPFYPDYSTSYYNDLYRGVFLNQPPDPENPNIPYYSVRVESTQIIGGFECVFDHWEASGANLVEVVANPEGYNQKAVVFTSEHAEVKAMYRMVQVSTQMSLSNGWNMVSLPSGLLDDSTDDVFPDAISQAFTYSPPGGYLGRNPLKLGVGYWLKYPQSMNPTIVGGKLVLDTIQLQAGWNMIGSLSSPLPVTSISLSEGTQLLSAFLGFAPGQGYVPATHINPGKAYWIKVAQNATMIMDVSAEQNMYTTTSLEEITSSPTPPAFPPGAALIAPVNGAENVTLPCTLRWSPTLSFPADSARVYWSTDDFLQDTHNSGKLTDTFYVATTLNTGTTYYWKVKIYHPVEGVLWSEVNTFTTGGIPAIPTLVSPENNTDSLTQPLTFTWNPVNGATSYHIQIGMGGYDPPSINKYVAGTSYTDSTLLGMNSYIWHVSAVNGFGEGDFSEDWIFSTRRLSLSVQSVQDGSVYHPKLSWTAEGNSAGATQYKLYRYDCAYGAGDCGATPTLITTTTARIYTDTYPMIMQGQTPNRTYWYYVKKGSTSNKVSWDGRIDAKVGILQEETPNRITLYDAYPNPFNPVTTIYYTLPEEMPVKIVISDVLGREIATLVDGIESAGYKTALFDASNLPSGIYFYRLTAGSFTDMKKMILAR